VLEYPDEFKYNIDSVASDENGVYISGWILHKKKIDELHLSIGNQTVFIKVWYSRPDVIKAYPDYSNDEKCGFAIFIPHPVRCILSFQARIAGQIINKTIPIGGSNPFSPAQYIDGGGFFNEFIKTVNDNHLKVLEIGSRIVSQGSCSKRPMFPGAKSYTGFDIYPDSNTDVVGDAHKLSQYFRDEKFDAIFSLSVFEHLAMPWVVAREINRVLETGGITFHSTHFSWPIHERPWDFFRFSDEGLKILFPPVMGYKIIKSGLFSPLRLYLDRIGPGQESLPFERGFGGASILAEKIFEADLEKFRWNTTLDEILDNDSHYPKK
jgi:SAM-dependent methyltransferase